MNRREIIEAYRRDTQDTDSRAYFVDDDEATLFLNEAEAEACRRARLLVDSTTEGLAMVDLPANEAIVELDPRIISIRRMRLQSNGRPIRKALVRSMDECIPGWETTANRSEPYIAVTDYQSDALYLYPVTNVAGRLLMTVTREPLRPMSEDDDEPEIAARYHYGLIHWMKYRTFMKEDSELFDPKRAEMAEKKFIEEFGERSSAINERFEFEQYHDIGEH